MTRVDNQYRSSPSRNPLFNVHIHTQILFHGSNWVAAIRRRYLWLPHLIIHFCARILTSASWTALLTSDANEVDFQVLSFILTNVDLLASHYDYEITLQQHATSHHRRIFNITSKLVWVLGRW